MKASDIAPCDECGRPYPIKHRRRCKVGKLLREFESTKLKPDATLTAEDIYAAIRALEGRNEP